MAGEEAVTAGDLAAALLAFRDKRGHWPNCGHRNWVGNYENGHVPGVECPADYECGGIGAVRGEGIACSKKCQDARKAVDQWCKEEGVVLVWK